MGSCTRAAELGSSLSPSSCSPVGCLLWEAWPCFCFWSDGHSQCEAGGHQPGLLSLGESLLNGHSSARAGDVCLHVIRDRGPWIQDLGRHISCMCCFIKLESKIRRNELQRSGADREENELLGTQAGPAPFLGALGRPGPGFGEEGSVGGTCVEGGMEHCPPGRVPMSLAYLSPPEEGQEEELCNLAYLSLPKGAWSEDPR